MGGMTLASLPRLGLGTWALGGPFFAGETALGWGEVPTAQALATIEAAYEGGIRIFDTAAVYGAGEAERRLGQALKGKTDVFIATKMGLAFDEETKQVLGEHVDAGQPTQTVEQSRQRLNRDQIDLVFLHLNSLPIDAAARVFDEMETLRAKGHIGAYGWSTDYPDRAAAFAQRAGFTSVQHAQNIFADVPTISGVMQNSGLWSFIRSPLAMGLLSGKYTADSQLSGDDIRGQNQDWIDYFKDGTPTPAFLSMLTQVRELLQTDGRTLTQGALAWVMAQSTRTVPIPGARTPQQAQENAATLQRGPLNPETLAQIEAIITRPPEGPARDR